MKICKIPGENNVAGSLTKQLARPNMRVMLDPSVLGLCLIGTSASGRLLV